MIVVSSFSRAVNLWAADFAADYHSDAMGIVESASQPTLSDTTEGPQMATLS
jgi:hypothetical protein